ncbi:hypothetical protein Q5752_006284 [Cryptotrichosporon argae]
MIVRHHWLAPLLVVWLVPGAVARSPHPPPVRRVQLATRSAVHILPRTHARALTPAPPTLRHDDTLLLSLSLPLLPDVRLLLRPSTHILHPDAQVVYGHGAASTAAPLRRHEWLAYTGEVIKPSWAERIWAEESAGVVRDRTDAVLGTAAVTVHAAAIADELLWEGTFTLAGVGYHVLTREHYERVRTTADVALTQDGALVVFSDEDRWHGGNGDGGVHDGLAPGVDALHAVHGHGHLRRDDIEGSAQSTNYAGSINSTSGCPGETRVVYMGVAADCAYVGAVGSAEAARSAMLADWNAVSALYRRTFNVALGIVHLVVDDAACANATAGETAVPAWNRACDDGYTLDDRLSDFSAWRADRAGDGAGLWHLMSACPTDTEVGVAWLGQLCVDTASASSGQTVSGTAISTATTTEWSLISHEIGHGFGAIHDCTSGCSLTGSCCPFSADSCNAGGNFIMNPTTSTSETTFSACSLGNICTAIGSTLNTTCMTSGDDETVITLNQCGNGIVEDGEECDPGSDATSSCCDVSTCKLVDGAVCDPANAACCTAACAYASEGTVCRAAQNAICDVAEVCTGSNATCPADKTAEDGTGCGGGLACASGQCTSLDLQCQDKGGSLNLTQACNQKGATSCIVTCADPSDADNCLVLQTALIDGSPCGYGGHCYNQTCVVSSDAAEISAWYHSNLQISVPVTVVASLLALALFALAARWGRQARQETAVPPTLQAPAVPIIRHSASIASSDPLTRTVLRPDPSLTDSAATPAGVSAPVQRATLAPQPSETVAAHQAYAEAYAETYARHPDFDRKGFEDYVHWGGSASRVMLVCRD